METTVKALVFGVAEEGCADCLLPEGRIAVRLRSDGARRALQKACLKYGSFQEMTLYEDPESRAYTLISEREIEDLSSRRDAFSAAVLELTDRASSEAPIGGHLLFLLKCFQSVYYGGIPEEAAYIKLAADLLKANGRSLDLERCGACGHEFISHSKFYFHPGNCRMECVKCIDGESAALTRETYFLLKRLTRSDYEALTLEETEKKSTGYLAYLMKETALACWGELSASELFCRKCENARKNV